MSVGNLVPNDRIIESNPPAKCQKRCRNAAETQDAGHTPDVQHSVTHASTDRPGNQNPEDLAPHLLQLGQKDLIILDVSELP